MEWSTYLQFFLALVFVLGLIMALSWALKRFGMGEGGRGVLMRKRRLATVESTPLDARHRVVLVRRDDVEHLVLIGPNTSQVIERGIAAVAGAPGDAALPPLSPFSAFRQLLSGNKQP